MSWLKDITNRDEAFWVARVQTLISTHTEWKEDGHGNSDTEWLKVLVDEVVVNLPPEGVYDGNMRLAATLALVFGLWYSQVHMAKTMDPNRPTHTRQTAYYRRLQWVQAMMEVLLDHSQLPTHFPGQKWEFPFDPEAKGGEFV